ncbi:predicted protein [Lichtheimia corymbifera JMRC:FSU:9682]|uniref:Uncharacterized protein n=1 Tax=Lichtheimia corymbifera JMRC:FSU:9682 TaxID=1263082 RepID=A0A068S5K8_9FUNG|nr:predicted protein [Lichtheimia corymbifera JMRC:FSU:9682]
MGTLQFEIQRRRDERQIAARSLATSTLFAISTPSIDQQGVVSCFSYYALLVMRLEDLMEPLKAQFPWCTMSMNPSRS